MSDNLTFKDKYKECKTWQDKAICISLYHTIMLAKYSNWTVTDTSLHFKVSIGLVSENIRLAREIDSGNKKVLNSETRENALKLIDKRRYTPDREIYTVIKE